MQFTVSSQKIVSFTIQDLENKGLQNVSILLKDTLDDNILNFIETDENGHGSFDISDYSAEKFLIHILNFNYQDTFFIINKFDNNLNFIVKLSPKKNLLNEVLISEKRLIRISDTTNIDLDRFRDSTDRYLEDILMKVPGFDLKSNGEIEYLGKKIFTVTINGEDLVSNNYKFLVTNLSAKLIEGIQVINNFNDIPLLNEIIATDKTVVNILVNENVKKINSELQAQASNKNYNLKLNSISILNKSKFILNSNFENIGIGLFDSYEKKTNSLSPISHIIDRNQLSHPLNPSTLPDITSFNKTFQSKLVYSTKLNLKTNNKLTFYGDLDKISKTTNKDYFLYSNEKIGENNFDNSFKLSNFSIDNLFTSNINKKSYLSVYLFANSIRNKIDNSGLSFDRIYEENSRNNTQKKHLELSYLYKIEQKSVISINYAHTVNDINLKSQYLPNFVQPSLELQNLKLVSNHSILETKFFKRFDNNLLNINLGGSNYSNLSQLTKANTIYRPDIADTKIDISEIYLSESLNAFYKNIQISQSLSLGYLNSYLSSIQSKKNPYYRFYLSFNKKRNSVSSHSVSISLDQNVNYFDNRIGLDTFQENTFSLIKYIDYPITNKRQFLGYTFLNGNERKIRNLIFSFSLQRQDLGYISESIIDSLGNFLTTMKITPNFTNILNIRFSYVHYISFLKSSAQAKVNLTTSSYTQVLNTNIQNNILTTPLWELQLKSGWVSPFQMSLKYQNLKNILTGTNLRNTFNQINIFKDLLFSTTNLNLKIEYNYFRIQSQKNNFLNFYGSYTFKNNVEATLTVYNILNNTTQPNINNLEVFYTSTTQRSRGVFFLVGTALKF